MINQRNCREDVASSDEISRRGEDHWLRSRAVREKCLRHLCLLVELALLLFFASTGLTHAQVTKLFLEPPVPVEGSSYAIRIKSATAGPPIRVDRSEVSVSGNVVDVTLYLSHGSFDFFPGPYETVVRGPLLPAGAYSFRYFVADKYPNDATYVLYPEPQDTVKGNIASVRDVAPAIEYYNGARDHYFLTAYEAEIVLLDAGHFSGWVRTGQQFPVYATDPSTNGIPSGLAPVCRYYGLPSFGLDTHYFSASTVECAEVKAKWPAQWVLETSCAFHVYLPDTTTGACPAGSVPVYRLYNQRADANHRYTTSLAIRQQMIDAHWIPEGYGAGAVGMCIVP